MSNLAKILAATTMLLIIIAVIVVFTNLALGIIIFFISMIYFATTISVAWFDIVEKADL
tara:strand:+ start:312 stop:488 length:177 start_codon:yes stop_codon:yes gene_type:complete